MLTKEENKKLMEVGPGTPMGDLMRRYWQPIAAVAELDETPTKAVRLMGEDLALYKDKSGNYGLVDLHCPHRRADMSYGMTEDCGIRCNYHGWAFDNDGNCTEMPFEEIAHPDANFKARVKIKAYKVQAKAGLLWAYMGPDPVPELWDWDVFHDNGYAQIVFSHIPCNWLQCAENDIDPVHFEWLHSNWSLELKGQRTPENKPPAHLKIGFDEFEWGFIYRRVREDTDEDNGLWNVGRVALWPNALYTGHFEYRVPIDDHNTLSVGWVTQPVPGDEPFEQERIPYWWSPIKDPVTGRWINTHTVQQDIIAWVGQGIQSDRENEHLGESDRGVIMLRKRFLDDLKVIEDGGDPKAILRDPSINHALFLPRVGRGATNTSAGVANGGEPPTFRRPQASTLFFGMPEAVLEDMRRVWEERSGAKV